MKKIIIFSVILLLIFLFGTGYVFAKSDICGPCCKDIDCAVGKCFDAGKDSAGNACAIKSVKQGEKDILVITAGKGGQCQEPDKTTFCPLSSYTEVGQLVDKVSGWIFILGLVMAPLMILLGGFYMLTAAGDPKKSTQGKQIITWALIGLGVILFAKAFISIIKSFL